MQLCAKKDLQATFFSYLSVAEVGTSGHRQAALHE